jgi:hypothetical protein
LRIAYLKQFPYTLNFPQKSEKTTNLKYSRTAFRLYKALEHFDRMQGGCMPSQQTLGRYVSKSVPSVQRGLRELREKGAILAHRHSQTSSSYELFGLKQSDGSLPPKSDGSGKAATKRPLIEIRVKLMGQPKKSDGSGDGSGDGSSIYTYPNSLPHQNLTEKGSSNVPAMPKFYTTHDDQRLYYLAYRWAKEVGVTLYPSEVAKAMQELEEAGALEMSEEQPLPEIRWRPARPNGPRASEQPERKPQQAADYFSSDIAALKKVMGGE